MIWWIYNILFPIGFLLMLPRFLVRMIRRGGYWPHFGERFGCYRSDILQKLQAGSWIWVHGVSVGEQFVVHRFIEEYRQRRPNARFVVSVTTSTGRRLAESLVGPNDVLIYFPLDFPWVVRRALDAVRPQMIVLVECELWPNLIRYASGLSIPVVLINGRLSEHSYKGYRRLKLFTRALLPSVSLLCVQGEREREMYLDLGAEPAKIHVLGSAKYDVVSKAPENVERITRAFEKAGIQKEDLILVGGSTWAGEEEALTDVFQKLRSDFPRLRLVLVPRHAERSKEIEKMLSNRGLTVARRSQLEDGAASGKADVVLVDTTGELRAIYGLATIIFVGKSLTQHGGQNIIEPAWWGKPIIVGPYMENFSVIMHDFLEADAVIQVKDVRELQDRIGGLLADAQYRETLGRRAREVVGRKAGVISRTLDLIAQTVGLPR